MSTSTKLQEKKQANAQHYVNQQLEVLNTKLKQSKQQVENLKAEIEKKNKVLLKKDEEIKGLKLKIASKKTKSIVADEQETAD